MLCFKCGHALQEQTGKYGLHEQCFADWFDKTEDFKALTLRKESTFRLGDVPNTSFFHGKFEKYSALLGSHQYILKISREHSELAKTEYLCNQMAQAMGLEVPPYFLIRFMGQDCFVSYNFMQDLVGADLKHIYHFLKPNDPYTIESLVGVIEAKTGRLRDIRKFLILCLFDALIGNDDRHGRNLALIFSAHGCTLSPCYDNPSFIARLDEWILGADLNAQGAVGTLATQGPTMEDYAQEIIRLGYRDILEAFLKSVNRQVLETLIQASFISLKRKKAFMTFIDKKIGELERGLH